MNNLRPTGGAATAPPNPTPRLSYKFQRLREQIRAAILDGEFQGRLPGERELGRRYHANAKTINKALCDLSSEGLLVRHIGRGTFVVPSNGEPAPAQRQRLFRCLLPETSDSAPYRDALLNDLTENIEAKNHVLDRITARTDMDSRDIPLSGWPHAIRRSTDGIFSYPCEPLSGGTGYLSDACVEEVFRRHIPTVVLAGYADNVKLDAVVPDYFDGGFRLGEHLFQAGCQTVVVLFSDRRSREATMVLNGCQTAAARYRCLASEFALRTDDDEQAVCDLKFLLNTEQSRHDEAANRPPVGLLCVGAGPLRIVRGDPSFMTHQAAGRVEMACVLEPGDDAAQQAGLTAYEVDPKRIAEWGARLILDARPGQRPVEISVPGDLRIRTGSTCD